ncbi:GHMP kinase [Flavobacterium faecale]|uniref:GHMP kinase n=1 Tax=Flavobacterium faecale TaxID=1355330 RepID=A0A2S1LBT9_9FLAO|nr:GYDIA family GHMP kinase [Flavobacterium faecale]AWG21202.1 GHMP kinase [Flavobacterium faecale]
METKTFYSNGKLLLTGEYLVLDGAVALAVPTKLGQSLSISKGNNQEIQWTSFDSDGSIWFETVILFSDIINFTKTETETVKDTLIRILHHAYLANPLLLEKEKGYQIETKLTFARQWGLGTSSTLINNIAQWLNIDAFELLNTSFGGSGYDIACAQNNNPITYQLEKGKPIVSATVFNPSFKDTIYFVYLNQKQNSKTAITNYKANKHIDLEKNIQSINQLTQSVKEATTAEDFCLALTIHEAKMSIILETPTVKEALFDDFNGTVKSLGAWGGDFVMVVSNVNPTAYFLKKGYSVIFSNDELILS